MFPASTTHLQIFRYFFGESFRSLFNVQSEILNVFSFNYLTLNIDILSRGLLYIDQPKLISKFKGRPDPTRPDLTTMGLTLFHGLSQLKLTRIQPNLKLKLTST